mmetsp:Transcript_6838/g.20849  ORF Transcript_6838/g.20849 Transcript_6838/m.20849 type:complete len:216 (-) Transcript_6838:836-1483(-)
MAISPSRLSSRRSSLKSRGCQRDSSHSSPKLRRLARTSWRTAATVTGNPPEPCASWKGATSRRAVRERASARLTPTDHDDASIPAATNARRAVHESFASRTAAGDDASIRGVRKGLATDSSAPRTAGVSGAKSRDVRKAPSAGRIGARRTAAGGAASRPGVRARRSPAPTFAFVTVEGERAESISARGSRVAGRTSARPIGAPRVARTPGATSTR